MTKKKPAGSTSSKGHDPKAPKNADKSTAKDKAGSPPKDAAAENPRAVSGGNVMTEDQQRGLFFNHLKKFVAQKVEIAEIEKELKAARTDFADLKKLIKAEGTLLTDLETACRLEDGEEKQLRGEIERQIKVGRWMGASLGYQFDLLDTDRRPAVDKAFEDGKIAGLRGLSRKPPHDPSVPQHQRWLEGWQEGQAALTMKLAPKAPPQVPAAPPKAEETPTPPAGNVVNLKQPPEPPADTKH